MNISIEMNGYESSDRITITTDYNAEQIKTAFAKGVEKLGFNITEFCNVDAEGTIPLKYADKLILHGFPIDILSDYVFSVKCEFDNVSLNTYEFANIYLFTAKLGDSNFTYQELEIETIQIGGGGLF